MDNYKIPNTEEAISLLDELGYDTTGLNDISSFLYAKAQDKNVFNGVICPEQYELISVAKLRDLVVLKRGDVSDANCIDKKREAWYLASDGTYYAWQYRKLCWDTESDACVEAHDIQPIEKSKPQDLALISGADAHKALLAGENVQYSGDGGEEHWDTALNCNIGVFLNQEKFPSFKFRIVPRTIKVNSELPKPHKETQHNSLVYAVTYEFKTREERNAFADKLRGNNS